MLCSLNNGQPNRSDSLGPRLRAGANPTGLGNAKHGNGMCVSAVQRVAAAGLGGHSACFLAEECARKTPPNLWKRLSMHLDLRPLPNYARLYP